MTLPSRSAVLAAVGLIALAAPVVLPVPALAQDAPAVRHKGKASAGTAKAAVASERKPGELEGWTSAPSAGAGQPAARRLPPGTIAAKPLPDGGIPLPAERTNDGAPPIAFDSNGRPSGAFRF